MGKKTAVVTEGARSRAQVLIEGAIEVHQDFGIVAVNPGLFPLPVVYAACRRIADEGYILLDGDPAEEVIIEVRKKESGVEMLGLCRRLGNHLVAELERYHLHVLPAIDMEEAEQGSEEPQHQPPSQAPRPAGKDASYLDDPLGIMKPWGSAK